MQEDGQATISPDILARYAGDAACEVPGVAGLAGRRAVKVDDTHVEVQAAASYSAWQILEAGVKGANSLDDRKIADYLRKNKVDTIQGKLRFDGPGNYGDDLMKIKQVQGGTWKVVWPTAFAAPGATLQM